MNQIAIFEDHESHLIKIFLSFRVKNTKLCTKLNPCFLILRLQRYIESNPTFLQSLVWSQTSFSICLGNEEKTILSEKVKKKSPNGNFLLFFFLCHEYREYMLSQNNPQTGTNASEISSKNRRILVRHLQEVYLLEVRQLMHTLIMQLHVCLRHLHLDIAFANQMPGSCDKHFDKGGRGIS